MELYRPLREVGEPRLTLLREVSKHPETISATDLPALAARHGVGAREIKPLWLSFDAATHAFALTEEGRRLATAWSLISDPDPEARFDFAYWPPDSELAVPTATWDWEDPPATLAAAVEGGAVADSEAESSFRSRTQKPRRT